MRFCEATSKTIEYQCARDVTGSHDVTAKHSTAGSSASGHRANLIYCDQLGENPRRSKVEDTPVHHYKHQSFSCAGVSGAQN